MTDIIDDIDALIDAQLARGPVDECNVNRYDRCPHCDRDWHGMAITERIEEMRWRGRYDEDYRVADDDSRVICPGSDFIGPMPPPLFEAELERRQQLIDRRLRAFMGANI